MLGASSCAVPPGTQLEDFAAIHDASSFAEKSPAAMWISPQDYHPKTGRPKHRLGDRSHFVVEDHQQLDEWLLQRIATIHPADFAASLEATGWLSLALLHDPYLETRIDAAAILSQFAGHWAGTMQVTLPRQAPTGDLASALNAVVQAYELSESPYFLDAAEAAYSALDSAAIADLHSSVRMAHGLATHLRLDSRLPKGGEETLARVGLRICLQALKAGVQSNDQQLADICQQRLDLLLAHLNQK